MKQCWSGSISKLTATLATYFRRLIGWPCSNSVSRRRHVVTFHYARNEYFEQDLHTGTFATHKDRFPLRTTSDFNTCNIKNTLSYKYGKKKLK
jgi:hypothetical protein